MPQKAIGSNPYLIHSQYRTGNAHHFADGARTTLMVTHGSETLDLAAFPVRINQVHREEDGVHMDLDTIELRFSNGVCAKLATNIVIADAGCVLFSRRITESSEPEAAFQLTEYFKGCWGTTEYPEEMGDIVLGLRVGNTDQKISYSYEGRCLSAKNCGSTYASIPVLDTSVSLEPVDGDFVCCEAEEGYLFNPYYTLRQSANACCGKGMKTALWLRKN